MSEQRGPTVALVHAPSPHLEHGQRTHLAVSEIDFHLAREQHAAYCETLRQCGAEVVTLDTNLDSPDGVFVEDAAVVLDEVAVIASMGTAARRAETPAIELALARHRPIHRIELPAKLEGGDVLRVGRELIVGLSSRTDAAGARALEAITRPLGYRVRAVKVHGCLHLKTACTAIDEETLLVNPDWLETTALADYRLLPVPPAEPWAANLLRLNDRLLLAAAHVRTAELLAGLGHRLAPIDISEFAKAEGGVTCLSILFQDDRRS
ncbi:MAG: arginine deiminase family protein [Pirellulaceae bacterium]